MKKYEYVNIDIDGVFSAGTIEHRKIIDKYAAKGYCYVGYIPTDITPHGKVTAIDLIFEMEGAGILWKGKEYEAKVEFFEILQEVWKNLEIEIK